LHGFLNVDKPKGITSYDVIRKIKKILPRKHKIGHLGTLDPAATGVLPVAVGLGTRLIAWMPEQRKEYIATMTLGGISDTQDGEGQITYTGKSTFEDRLWPSIIEDFTGPLLQIPPMFSAVRHQGRRLYDLARQGVEVERKARAIWIYGLEMISQEKAEDLPRITLKVSCSSGTYIRTLCHDIGTALGTGAYLSSLRRTRSGFFSIDSAGGLEEITDDLLAEKKRLLPLNHVLQDFPAVEIQTPQEQIALFNGNAIDWFDERAESLGEQQLVAITRFQEVIALARVMARKDGTTMLQPVRVLIDTNP
jgi:tRNA pseudouridine55 synthase